MRARLRGYVERYGHADRQVRRDDDLSGVETMPDALQAPALGALDGGHARVLEHAIATSVFPDCRYSGWRTPDAVSIQQHSEFPGNSIGIASISVVPR